MHVMLIVIGLLLMVFGGGCTLIVGGLAVADLQGTMRDPIGVLLLGGGIGVLPFAIGWLSFQRGMKIDREKRKSAVTKINDSKPEADK